jgi:hypothetical protein
MATDVGPKGPQGDPPPKPSLADRIRGFALKPEPPNAPAPAKSAYELSGEELVLEESRANDKERAIGLLAGPVATIITFFVVHLKVASDPPAYLANGAINRLHVNPSTYTGPFWVLIILSFGITTMALWRKRLFLGIVTSMFGLSIFTFGYLGFGVPFVMVGAWYLVRAYRLHRNLKESTAAEEGPSTPSRPTPNKRYTPKSSLSQKRPPVDKPRPEPDAD